MRPRGGGALLVAVARALLLAGVDDVGRLAEVAVAQGAPGIGRREGPALAQFLRPRQVGLHTALLGAPRGFGGDHGDLHLAILPRQQPQAQARTKASHKIEDMELGQLSARFESGSDGIAAVGYDRVGGTSYGKYQVSSRAGSLKDFLDFLDTEAPELSRRLRASGPGNTGSRKGAMPDTWRAIASEQPERFENLQEAFVHQSHYKPALDSIAQRTGLNPDKISTAMREVIWSTSVQHGPSGAARIFERAHGMSGSPSDPSYERNLINNVYNIRVGQFGSSDSNIQAAVANRFKQEKALALNMLNGGKNSSLA